MESGYAQIRKATGGNLANMPETERKGVELEKQLSEVRSEIGDLRRRLTDLVTVEAGLESAVVSMHQRVTEMDEPELKVAHPSFFT